MESTASFGYWVRRRRKALDLTQGALAWQVGCARVTIKKIERDERRPSQQMAERLADCLAIPNDERRAFLQAARGELAIDRLPLDAQPLAVDKDPQRVLITYPNNLPVPATRLIGREREIAAVLKLLRKPDARLIVLTGVGGVGKTRVGLETAMQWLPECPDGAFFISLASVRDPEMMPLAISQVLGVKESSIESTLTHLKVHLREKRLLLLLDNFETVLPSAPLVAELLAATPYLKILVTSRATLRLSSEWELVVLPLSLPERASYVSHLRPDNILGSLAQSEAVQLFLERAHAAGVEINLEAEALIPVAEICHLLDGLPLAIELAAARLRGLPLAILLDQLVGAQRLSPLQLLTGEQRDLPARQQTLRSTIDWSYDLLDEAERRLFARLGVFVRGCTLESVQAVAGDLPGDCDPGQLLNCLGSLVEKSMLRWEITQGSQPRYAMLEVMREYAMERLAEAGERDDVYRRTLLYYTALAEEAEPHLWGSEDAVWLKRLDLEWENMRATLTWALREETIQDLDVCLASRLAGSLAVYWYLRGALNEGRYWLETALSRLPSRIRERAKLLTEAGALAWQQGDYAVAGNYLDEGVAIWREVSDQAGLAEALHWYGHLTFDQQDYSAAQQLFEESLGLYDLLRDEAVRVSLIGDLGLVAYHLKQFELARQYFEQSLVLFRKMDNTSGIGGALIRLGDLARIDGDHTLAGDLYEEGLACFQKTQSKLEIAWSYHKLGFIARHSGDLSRARDFFTQSLILQKEAGNKQGIAECLAGLAGLAAFERQPERAARLFAAAKSLLGDIGAPLAPADQAEWELDEAAARRQIDEARYTAFSIQGQELPLDQIVAYALGEFEI